MQEPVQKRQKFSTTGAAQVSGISQNFSKVFVKYVCDFSNVLLTALV